MALKTIGAAWAGIGRSRLCWARSLIWGDEWVEGVWVFVLACTLGMWDVEVGELCVMLPRLLGASSVGVFVSGTPLVMEFDEVG